MPSVHTFKATRGPRSGAEPVRLRGGILVANGGFLVRLEGAGARMRSKMQLAMRGFIRPKQCERR